MEVTEIEDLLEEVSKKIEEQEEEKNRLNESFNFFKILGIETKEKYHSKFISQLLNPKGLHGCGDKFLKLFIEILADKLNLVTININNVSVITEFKMGDIPDDYSEGGFIDIYLKINQTLFLIENKIHAGDQKKQIIRYNRYKEDEKANYKSCHILYLTLDSKSPDSCGDLVVDEHFHCISYQDHIHTWLEKCIDISLDNPIVNETIKGYLIVVKFLTKQTSYHKMQNEIKNILLGNPAYLNAAAELSNVLSIIKNEADEKVIKINRLLKMHDFDKKIGNIEIEGDYDWNGRMFIVKIYNTELVKIEIGNEDGVICCDNEEFLNCKALTEPYKAEDFVNAFIDDLTQKYLNI